MSLKSTDSCNFPSNSTEVLDALNVISLQYQSQPLNQQIVHYSLYKN